MSRRIASAVLLLAAISPNNTSHAKPADLPGDILHQCPVGREQQQLEGFSRRPDATEALPAEPAPTHTRQLTRRPVRDAGGSEEQDAPPVRANYRGPTERRDATTGWRMRELDRHADEDARRQEMLRQTEPLDTLRQREINDGYQPQDEESSVSLEEECDLPAVVLPEQRVEGSDLSWLPEATRVNIRAYREWKKLQIDPPPTSATTITPVPLRKLVQELTPMLDWIPGFDFDRNGFDRLDNERRRIESMRFPWNNWSVRLRHGLIWFEWPQTCEVRLYERDPSERQRNLVIRGFVDGGGSVIAMEPPAFVSNSAEFVLNGQNGYVSYGQNGPQFGPMMDFTCDSIGLSKATIRADAFAAPVQTKSEFPEHRCTESYRGQAVSTALRQTIGYIPGFLSSGKGPMLILVYPVEDELIMFDVPQSGIPPGIIGDFYFFGTGPYF